MKIFHTENNKEVVYVQMQDIMHLVNETSIAIPVSIMTKVFKGVVIVDDSNRFDFVKFEEEHEVKFFKELEFIIDFGKYKDYTNEQFNEEFQSIADKANKVTVKWNDMHEEERIENTYMLEEYENLRYMLKFITIFHAVKNCKKTMQFPDFIKVTKKKRRLMFFIK